MGNVAIEESYVSNLADSIRERCNIIDTMKLSDMASYIDTIDASEASKSDMKRVHDTLNRAITKIESNVTSLAYEAVHYCSDLKVVKLPECAKLSRYSFTRCGIEEIFLNNCNKMEEERCA